MSTFNIEKIRSAARREAAGESGLWNVGMGPHQRRPTIPRSVKYEKIRYTISNQLRETILCSWLNLLLVFVPVGFVVYYLDMNPMTVFFINFAAIFPLNLLFSVAVDELKLRVGNFIGVLLYMSFGNATLFVTSILLLKSRQIDTLKTSILGGILTTNLLIIGVAFCLGGLRRSEQFYNSTTTSTMLDLLLVTTIAFLIPTASSLLAKTSTSVVTQQSRGSAFILIVLYVLWIYFEVFTHAEIVQEPSKKVPVIRRKHAIPEGGVVKSLAVAGSIGAAMARPRDVDRSRPSADEIFNRRAYEEQLEKDDATASQPRLSFGVCVTVLVVGTVLLAFNTKFMTDSIEGLTTDAGVPRDFIGLVLLPILSSDLAAIQVAYKDDLDIAIHSSLGKSLQCTLVVTPLLVLLAWAMQIEDMNLLFDGYQTTSLLASVLLIQHSMSSGKSNWLMGATFALTYVMIGIGSWFQGTGD